MSNSVIIHELAKHDLKGAILIDGFPGVGLVGTIVANFLINTLKLKQIGVIDSQRFPPISVIKEGEPHNPMRLYAGEQICNDGTCNQVAVCVSEFTPPGEITKDLVKTLLNWAEKKGSNEIIILDGVASSKHDNKVFCAAEADLCRIMEDNGIEMIPQGFITGISGGILNECLIRKIKGVVLLAKANESLPDSLASVTLIEAINKTYGMKIDTDELKKQEKQIGNDLKELSDQYSEHKKLDSNMYM